MFEPAHRRLEANEERQRDIERAFEDMYMAHTSKKLHTFLYEVLFTTATW